MNTPMTKKVVRLSKAVCSLRLRRGIPLQSRCQTVKSPFFTGLAAFLA